MAGVTGFASARGVNAGGVTVARSVGRGVTTDGDCGCGTIGVLRGVTAGVGFETSGEDAGAGLALPENDGAKTSRPEF